MPTPSTLVELNTKQKQYLKGLAHPLNPYVQIGKEGLSESTIRTIDSALHHHELIKVKIGNNSGLEKHSTAATVAEKTGSIVVQLIGKVIVLYRPNSDKPGDQRIVLPKTR
jgi:RNA-binding protein